MNKLRKNSNLLVALFAFAHLVIGSAAVVINNLNAVEMYKNGADPYMSERIADMIMQRLPANIISSLIHYIPALLLVIYSLFLYKKKKNHALLTVSFVMSIALSLWKVLSALTSSAAMSRYIGYSNSPYTQEDAMQMYLPQIILNLVLIIIYIFFAVDSSKAFKFSKVSKVLSVIQAAVLCAAQIISLSANEKFYSSSINSYVDNAVQDAAQTAIFMNVLIPALLAIATLVFWWITVPTDGAKLNRSELEKLRKKFESGKIDEKTYNEKRAEIIEKI